MGMCRGLSRSRRRTQDDLPIPYSPQILEFLLVANEMLLWVFFPSRPSQAWLAGKKGKQTRD